MTYNASITQDASSSFRDPLIFYDPDLTTGNNSFPVDDLDGINNNNTNNLIQQRDLPFEDEEEGFYEKDLPKHACV
jgi:hypothetical protein